MFYTTPTCVYDLKDFRGGQARWLVRTSSTWQSSVIQICITSKGRTVSSFCQDSVERSSKSYSDTSLKTNDPQTREKEGRCTIEETDLRGIGQASAVTVLPILLLASCSFEHHGRKARIVFPPLLSRALAAVLLPRHSLRPDKTFRHRENVAESSVFFR